MVTPFRYSDRVAGFTKLFGTIIHSTVWQEAQHVKVVWITLLAMCGRQGIVEASVPGLAKAAGVSLAECQDALTRLSSPDSFSRTQDHEGRRIQEIAGGWLVLNYLKYRARVDEDAQRMATAERVRRYRAKKPVTPTVTGNANVTGCNAGKRQAEAEAEAEAEKRHTGASGDAHCAAFLLAYPRKRGKKAAKKTWKALRPSQPLVAEIMAAVKAQSAPGGQLDMATQADKEGRCCVPYPATWLNGRRWEDGVEAAVLRPATSSKGRELQSQINLGGR